LLCDLLKFKFLHFSAGRQRKFFHEKEQGRNPVNGNTGAAILFHFQSRCGFPRLQANEGHDVLPVVVTGNPDHLDLPYFRMRQQKLLDLRRKHIFAAPNDQFLDPARNAEPTDIVGHGEVSGMQPTLVVNGFGGGFRHAVIALHESGPAQQQFALFPRRQSFAGSGINNLRRIIRHRNAYCAGSVRQCRIWRIHQADQGFGRSIQNPEFRRMHAFSHLSRQLRRAKGAGHIAAPHRRQVVGPLVEFRQRGDKHGGSAGYGGSAVSLHSGEKIRRAKTLNNHRGRSGRKSRKQGQAAIRVK